MGLDCSHDAWSGAYSAFHRWRCKIAEVAGLPPLELMEGFYSPLGRQSALPPTLYHGVETGKCRPTMGRPYLSELDDRLPIRWDCLNPSPLHELLYHSDCDGEIASGNCIPIAAELEKLIPDLPDDDDGGHIGNWREKTQRFVNGLREAGEKGEPLEFF